MGTDHLWRAFHDGFQLEHKRWGQIALQRKTLGELVLPTGWIVACDPLVFPETPPFAEPVAPGRYPVMATMASFAEPDTQKRVACACLVLSDEEPVIWELARLVGEDVAQLQVGHSFGYSVDAGVGCFMDSDAALALERRMSVSWAYTEGIINEFASNEFLNLVIDPSTGMNVLMFYSGWGDGFYSSYWGYNAEKQKVCLLTDFGLLDEPAPHGIQLQRASWGRLEPIRRFFTS